MLKSINGVLYVSTSWLGQGIGYKDYDAWGTKNEIVYIPEYAFEDDNIETILDDGEVFYKLDTIKTKYTTNDIMEVCKTFGIPKRYAWQLFDTLDWQHPESLADEFSESI